MWSTREATPADAETLFWRTSPEAQEAYREREALPIAHLQWLVMDSHWAKVLEYPESGPVGMLGAVPLGKSRKGLLWFLDTPMASSRPLRLVKALKRAISELETLFPEGLCGIIEDPKAARVWRQVGFAVANPVEIAGRQVTPMELL